jgi:(p)ppGpp synthase/HD superfamily hydrolase
MSPEVRINYFLTDALDLAVSWHADQWRKFSGSPYIVHCLEVDKRVGRWGIDKYKFPDVRAACYLHDVLEDNKLLTPDDVSRTTNEVVRGFVEELTFRPENGTKEEYLASFATKSVESLVVKLADRFCNVEDFLCDSPDYAVKYWNKAMPLFVALRNREQEIAEKFGMEVLVNIMNDYDHVLSKL